MPDEHVSRIVSLKVARRLRDERLRRGLSTRSLAEKAGLSQPMISYVERGMRIPTLETALRIAGALNIDLWKVIRLACMNTPDAKKFRPTIPR